LVLLRNKLFVYTVTETSKSFHFSRQEYYHQLAVSKQRHCHTALEFVASSELF